MTAEQEEGEEENYEDADDMDVDAGLGDSGNLTDEDDDDGEPRVDASDVDPDLASAMGLEAMSPEPPSAYVGTVAYELNEQAGQPEPFSMPEQPLSLHEELAKIEQLD